MVRGAFFSGERRVVGRAWPVHEVNHCTSAHLQSVELVLLFLLIVSVHCPTFLLGQLQGRCALPTVLLSSVLGLGRSHAHPSVVADDGALAVIVALLLCRHATRVGAC